MVSASVSIRPSPSDRQIMGVLRGKTEPLHCLGPADCKGLPFPALDAQHCATRMLQEDTPNTLSPVDSVKQEGKIRQPATQLNRALKKSSPVICARTRTK